MDENGRELTKLKWWMVPALALVTVVLLALVELLELKPLTLWMIAGGIAGAAFGYALRAIWKKPD